MKRMLMAAAALALVAGPALAKNDHADNGRGHAQHVPPGLAKKPMGLPPGQAKKMWRQGQYLPRSYIVERNYIQTSRYQLPAPPAGYRWVAVQDDAYLVQNRTGLISRVIADLLG